ncbi:MAG: hypothetical protein J2P51_11920, partial [Hyphomicrobiaceae bacterium]|nr:hypothetical protein [Hyphomicrobiaceae bacterium]
MHLAWLKPPFILAAPHFARRLSCMCAARDISTPSKGHGSEDGGRLAVRPALPITEEQSIFDFKTA